MLNLRIANCLPAEPRKVVFIAGANWSGSTLVGCILGASRHAFEPFHVGEAHSFFRPDKPNYGRPRGVSRVTKFWDSVDHTVGPENAYLEIARKSDTRVIVDSSKAIPWLATQMEVCRDIGAEFILLVTFRPFEAFFRSAEKKRGDAAAALQNLRYYDRFFEELDENVEWASVNIENLVRHPERSTKILCDYTGIPYFPGKSKYWKYHLFHLYGSSSQRKRLNEGEKAFRKPQEKRVPHPLATALEKENFRANERRLQRAALI